jgi:hypothetical protein
MKPKINTLNVIRIVSFLLFAFYLTLNGVDMKMGSLRLYIKGLKDHIQSEK